MSWLSSVSLMIELLSFVIISFQNDLNTFYIRSSYLVVWIKALIKVLIKIEIVHKWHLLRFCKSFCLVINYFNFIYKKSDINWPIFFSYFVLPCFLENLVNFCATLKQLPLRLGFWSSIYPILFLFIYRQDQLYGCVSCAAAQGLALRRVPALSLILCH